MQNSKVKLKIKGMHCSSCAILIDGDLEDLDGVKSASTSYAKSECEVEFDSGKVDLKKLVKTIENIGYEVSN